MLFVKAAKLIAAGIAITPLAGCAIATGLVFGQFMRSVALAPDLKGSFFAWALLAFALIESFGFMSLGVTSFILSV